MLLIIQFLTGRKGFVKDLKETDTVGDLKKKISELDGAPAAAAQSLLFGGQLLGNDSITLADLDIFGETSIMCVSKPTRPAAVRPAAAAAVRPAAAAAVNTAGSATHATAAAAEVPVAAATNPEVTNSDADVEAKEGEAHAVAAADAGNGGGAAAMSAVPGEAAAPEKPEEMIALALKTLRGTSTLIRVPAHATFGHIKHKYIQPIEDIPAIQMRLIYMGQLTDDSKTPFDYNICKESFIHLVRRPNESIKNEIITKVKLMANCRWCNKAGVQLVLRPQCRVCGNEGVMYKDRVITVGKSKWADLEDLKGMCFSCGDGNEVDLSMGFLCTGQPGAAGQSCPSRIPTARKMIHTYQGGDLVESLNQIFGYAHARGFEV